MYLVSACLVGIKCRYNGGSTEVEPLCELVRTGQAVTACPEVLGGLSTPRNPCEIVVVEGERRVIDTQGNDLTQAFVVGAETTLDICKKYKVDGAILQSRSPSCGCGRVYNGQFSGDLIEGDGLTTLLLKANGIAVMSEDDWLSERK